MTKDADFTPLVVGEKTRVMVQPLPEGIGVPEHASAVMLNWSRFAPASAALLMFRGNDPVLWAVMVWGELVLAGSCTPKNSEARSSVRAGPCRKILTPSSTGSGIAKSILPSALKSPAAIPAGKA